MPHIKQRRALVLLVALVLIFGQLLLGLPLQLRSSSSALNHWAAAFALVAMPVLAIYGAPALPPHWLSRKFSLVAAVLAAPTLLLAGCTALFAPSFGQSDDFQQISEGQAGWSTYRLYRTDCGATCATGLVLRKEFDLVMGLALVTPIWSMYRASDGSVSVDDSAVWVTRGASVLAEIAR
jgi:hypothetical protein